MAEAQTEIGIANTVPREPKPNISPLNEVRNFLNRHLTRGSLTFGIALATLTLACSSAEKEAQITPAAPPPKEPVARATVTAMPSQEIGINLSPTPQAE